MSNCAHNGRSRLCRRPSGDISAVVTIGVVIAVAALIVVGFVSGCAIHAPISETIMFHHRDSSRIGLVVAGTRQFTSVDALRRAATREFKHNDALEFSLDNGGDMEKKAAGLALTAYFDERDFAISTTVGIPLLGSDVTIHLGREYYVTASASMAGGLRAILQRPIINTTYFDASAGVAYRSELFFFEAENTLPSDTLYPEYPGGPFSAGLGFPEDAVTVSSFGIRSRIATYPPWVKNSDFGGTVYIGYSHTLREPVVTVSASLGGF